MPRLMRGWSRTLLGALAALGSAAAWIGCSATQPELDPHAYTASAPGVAWKPARGEAPAPLPGEKPPPIPPALQAPETELTLAELVDTALQINPTTRVAWENARTAAAAWAVSRGRYFPTITGSVGVEYARGGVPTEFVDRTEEIERMGGTLRYLLLDFGGRSATAEAA